MLFVMHRTIISAIDNVTRKLMQDGKRPLLVSFFFSLGHSTIVILLSILMRSPPLALKLISPRRSRPAD